VEMHQKSFNTIFSAIDRPFYSYPVEKNDLWIHSLTFIGVSGTIVIDQDVH